MQIILTLIIGYILGSIPFGFLAGKWKGIDIRAIGSGNIGATNVGRALGKKWKYTVLLLDLLKGGISVLIPQWLFPQAENLNLLQIMAGMASICGHNWTIFLKFKGGKGVATSAGVILFLEPIAFGLGLATYILITKITKYVSLGSMLASLVVANAILILNKNDPQALPKIIFGFVICFFVVIRHKENIKRLLKGQENKTI